MNITKQAMIIGAGVLAIGASGLGVSATTSALQDSDGESQNGIVSALASKFNLKEDEVNEVFNDQREERSEAMKAEREESLKSALNDEKISQAQYDHITSAWSELDQIRDGEKTDENRQKANTIRKELHVWIEEQNIDKSALGMPEHGGRHGGDHGMREDK